MVRITVKAGDMMAISDRWTDALQPIIDMVRRQEDMMAAVRRRFDFPPSIIDVASQQKMIEAMRGPASLIDSIRANDRLLESANALAEQQRMIQNDMALLVEPFAAIEQARKSWAIPKALALWNRSWQNTAAEIARSHVDVTALTSRLLEPERVYTDFAAKTLRLIERTPDFLVKSALQLSVELPEIQLARSRSIIDNLLTSDELVEDDRPVLPVIPLRLVTIQRTELKACGENLDGAGYEDILQCSPAANTNEDAHTLIGNVILCNREAKSRGLPAIFKLTDSLVEACNDLPSLVPTDKRSLTNYVLYLYIIFYEGAGGDKLRFHQDTGGALDDSDCDFIWTVKHLRDKWLVHDPEHGSPDKVKKALAQRREALARLGFDCMPSRAEEYRQLHRNLLADAIAFTNTLADKLRATQANLV